MNSRPTHLPAAVLWDMDGTLVDTEPYWFEAERDLVESYGHEWTDDHAHALVGFDLLDSAEYIREHGRVPLAPEEIVERMLDGVVERIREKLIWRPGARGLLAELNAAGVPCVLVTMSWRQLVDPIIEALPEGTFQAVIVGDEVPFGRGKPNPDPFEMGAAAVGASPHDCVAIEDSPTGVRSALAAGCHVVGVPNTKVLKPAPRLTLVESLRDVDLATFEQLFETRSAGAVRHRRPVVLGGLIALAAAVVGTAFVVDRSGDDRPELPPGAVAVDVWVPFWALDDSLAEVEVRLDAVREASPFWFGARSATEIVVDENVVAAQTDQFLEQAADERVDIVPSIRDQMPAGGMAAVLANPTTRTTHVETIVAFADDLDVDGIDLDYEQFAFADDDSTWPSTAPNWVAFVAELADALHDDDRTLTVSVPTVFDPDVTGGRGYWVYEHGAIAEYVDAIRIMAYDFSVAEPGPIAPLTWVQDAVDGVSLVVPEEFHHKLVLGVPSYGVNWVVSTSGECPATAEGRTNVTAHSVLELAAKRSGTPQFDAVTGEWFFTYDLAVTDGVASCVQSRRVHWVDAEGAASRVTIAREAGWGGVALWALGYEDDAVWHSLITAATAVQPVSTSESINDQ